MANAGWLERALGKDPDEVFSYTTKKYVIISDKTIALLSLFLRGAVLFYIVFYVRDMYRPFTRSRSMKLACRTWGTYTIEWKARLSVVMQPEIASLGT